MSASIILSAFMLLLWLTTAARPQSMPAVMPEEVSPVMATSAGRASNLALLSLSASSGFDDNLDNSRFHRSSGGQHYFSADFGLQQSRRRLQWNLSYRPALGVGTRSVAGNRFNQLFGTTLAVQATARLSVRVRQDYLVTTDPFDRLSTASLEPELSPLDRPNDLPDSTQLKRTSGYSAAALSYRFTRHVTAGLSGSYAAQNYSDYPAGTPAAWINTRTASGRSFISRRFSSHYASGLEYRWVDFQFPGYAMRTQAQTLLWFHELALTATSSIVLSGGPEYSRTHNQAGFGSLPSISWSPAAAAIYTISGSNTGLQATLVRRVSDGGGVLGPVRMNAGSLRISRRLSHRWSADMGAELAQETALYRGPANQLRVLRAGAGFVRHLGRNQSLRIAYDRLYQNGDLLGYAGGNHNRVMVSLQRTFAKPLGR